MRRIVPWWTTLESFRCCKIKLNNKKINTAGPPRRKILIEKNQPLIINHQEPPTTSSKNSSKFEISKEKIIFPENLYKTQKYLSKINHDELKLYKIANLNKTINPNIENIINKKKLYEIDDINNKLTNKNIIVNNNINEARKLNEFIVDKKKKYPASSRFPVTRLRYVTPKKS